MKSLALLFICSLVLVGFVFADTNINGNIETSATWTLAGSPYIINGDYLIQGETNPIITIEAGVQVRFVAGASLALGFTSSSALPGGMVVNGTAANPVTFTAHTATPTPGFWECVRSRTYATQNYVSFNYTIFEYGGNGGTGMFDVSGGNPAFDHCTFRYSSNFGIYHGSSSVTATVNNTAFNNNGSYPMYWNCTLAGSIGTGNTFSGNTYQRILLKSIDMYAAQTWSDEGIPFEMESDLQLYNYANSLVLNPGVQILFRNGKRLFVGHPSSEPYAGSISANGAIFGAVDPGTGWNGLHFNPLIQPSSFSSCTIRDVNSTPVGSLVINSNNNVTVQNCTFTSNNNYALYCYEYRNFSMTGSTISNCAKTVRVYPVDMQNLGSGNQYLSNTDNRIHCPAGTIDATATWTAQSIPIYVSGNIQFTGTGNPVLTIPYGTVLEFGAGFYMSIGHTSSSLYSTILLATGVTFRGAVATAGYWEGLLFNVIGGSSLLSGCTIKDAGEGNVAAIRCNVPASTITGCTIQNCLAQGINLSNGSLASLSANTVTTCGSYPLSIYADNLRVLSGQNQFTGNTIDRVEVRAGTVETTGTWYNPGVPYALTTSINIYGTGNPHISIMPGTIIMLPGNSIIGIGHPTSSLYPGSLEADGATFTRVSSSVTPYGLVFNAYATPGASVFTDCIFEYMQSLSNSSAVYVGYSDPVFQSCIFRNNPAQGLVVSANARPTATDCEFTNNGGYPISAYATSFAAVSGVGNKFSGNNPNRILIAGNNITQSCTWNNPSVPVEVSSTIQVFNDALPSPILKINSGLVLLFRTGTYLYIGHTTASLYLGGLQADGATFSPLSGVSGGWSGIHFYTYSLASSYLSNCIVEKSGGHGNIYVYNSPMSYIDSCILRDGVYGVHTVNSNVIVSITRNYILGNQYGVTCEGGANPIIGGSTGQANCITGNISYGVINYVTSLTVNAEYNWWGNASGPYHATTNPTGTGDKVYNYVDYTPWRTTNIGDGPSRFHLLTPENESVVETLTPVLDWAEAIDPTPGDVVTYSLLIARNAGFTTGLITVNGLTATVYHVPGSTLTDDTRYYWKVSATDTQNQTVWCYESYFYFDTAVPEAPGAFALLNPTYDETVHLTSQAYSWQAAVDPDPGDIVSYMVYTDISAGFENAIVQATSDTSIYSEFCAPGGLYYWKVKAFDTLGHETFSPTWRFFVHPDARPRPPVQFTIEVSGQNVIISWDTVPGADYYIVYRSVDAFSGFEIIAGAVYSTSYTYLLGATQHFNFFKVVAVDNM
jgi:hypothetical protein